MFETGSIIRVKRTYVGNCHVKNAQGSKPGPHGDWLTTHRGSPSILLALILQATSRSCTVGTEPSTDVAVEAGLAREQRGPRRKAPLPPHPRAAVSVARVHVQTDSGVAGAITAAIYIAAHVDRPHCTASDRVSIIIMLTDLISVARAHARPWLIN